MHREEAEMPLLGQKAKNAIGLFGAVTNWAGAVIVPILLFVYGQRIEDRLEAQRKAQEVTRKQQEDLARSTALLANVAPLLFSNDTGPVTFALQILAPGDAQIPPQLHPLLLEVVTLYKQKNPPLSDLAESILLNKISPSDIQAAQQLIPQQFAMIVGGPAPVPVAVAPAPPAIASGGPRMDAHHGAPPAPAPGPETPAAELGDVQTVAAGILSSRYNVIVASASSESSARSLAASTTAKLHAAGLAACWKHPVAQAHYYGVAIGNGVSLADAQGLLHKAREAGIADAYVKRIETEPTACLPA